MKLAKNALGVAIGMLVVGAMDHLSGVEALAGSPIAAKGAAISDEDAAVRLASAGSTERRRKKGESDENPPPAEPDDQPPADPNDSDEKPKKAPRVRRPAPKGKAPDRTKPARPARGKKKTTGNDKQLEALEKGLLSPPKDFPDREWTALWRENLGVAVGLTAESNFPKAKIEYNQLDVSDGLALENRSPCRIELLSEWTKEGNRDKRKNELRVVGEVPPGVPFERRSSEKVFLHVIANDRRGNARGVDFDYFTIRLQPERTMLDPLDITIVVEVGLAEDQSVGVNDRDVAWSFLHVLPKEKADETYQLMASRPIPGVQEIRWIQRHGDPKSQVTERTTIPFVNGVQGEATIEVLTRFTP